MAEWKIKINPAKTKAIFFTRRRTLLPERRLSLHGEQIDWVDQVKYLGLIFDEKLTWHANTSYLISKARKATFALYPLLNRRSRLSLKSKLLLYRTIILPSMAYGCVSWNTCKPYLHKKLQQRQNITLRIITDSRFYIRNTTIHRDLRQDTIRQHITKTVQKYYTKTDATNNPFIRRSHILSDPRRPYRLPRDWTIQDRQ